MSNYSTIWLQEPVIVQPHRGLMVQVLRMHDYHPADKLFMLPVLNQSTETMYGLTLQLAVKRPDGASCEMRVVPWRSVVQIAEYVRQPGHPYENAGSRAQRQAIADGILEGFTHITPYEPST